ncbi:hypothetical protein CCMA1212_003329 [Trichoderma ghanense]|uniref:Uncharacterized protein n=1 Tax=Trichoderma ghanense TaxID=65468 RepID=A0ABY2H9W6_9HYPO
MYSLYLGAWIRVDSPRLGGDGTAKGASDWWQGGTEQAGWVEQVPVAARTTLQDGWPQIWPKSITAASPDGRPVPGLCNGSICGLGFEHEHLSIGAGHEEDAAANRATFGEGGTEEACGSQSTSRVKSERSDRSLRAPGPFTPSPSSKHAASPPKPPQSQRQGAPEPAKTPLFATRIAAVHVDLERIPIPASVQLNPAASTRFLLLCCSAHELLDI